MDIQKLNQQLKKILNEFALPFIKIKEKVGNLSFAILEHTIKILLYGKDEFNLHHWCHEVNNWIDQCFECEIKKIGKNRFPNSDEVFLWLLQHFPSSKQIARIRKRIENEYTQYPNSQMSNEDLYEKIKLFYKEVCDIAENNNNDDKTIEEIVKKFV